MSQGARYGLSQTKRPTVKKQFLKPPLGFPLTTMAKAKEGLFELWSLMVAGACLYLCSIIIGQLSPAPSEVLRAVPEDPYAHRIRRTLDLRESMHTGGDSRRVLLQVLKESVVRHRTMNVDSTKNKTNIAKGDKYVIGDHSSTSENAAGLLLLQEVNDRVERRTKTHHGVDTRLKVERYGLVINQGYLCHQVENDDTATVTAAPPGSSINSSAVNNNDMSVYLLIIVHSHPAHKRRRNAIRETWGRVVRSFNPTHQVVLVFMLGIPRDYDEYQSVKREARLYRDTVVYDFADEYRNLSLKSLLGLQWACSYCGNARFVIKADDDVYLNIPAFIEELNKYSAQDLILGSVNPRSPVKRYGQWRVDYREYPYNIFPPYVSGCTYAMSGDVARRLYHVSQSSQSPAVVPVEDVYITGLLAGALGIRCRHHTGFPTWITVPSVRHVQRFLTGDILGLHGVDWIRMHTVWQMIHKCANCSTSVQQVQHWLSWLMDIDPMYR